MTDEVTKAQLHIMLKKLILLGEFKHFDIALDKIEENRMLYVREFSEQVFLKYTSVFYIIGYILLAVLFGFCFKLGYGVFPLVLITATFVTFLLLHAEMKLHLKSYGKTFEKYQVERMRNSLLIEAACDYFQKLHDEFGDEFLVEADDGEFIKEQVNAYIDVSIEKFIEVKGVLGG